MDDPLLRSLGDEAVGVISAAAYLPELDTPTNKRFACRVMLPAKANTDGE
jgi:hypothetical protein